MQALLLATHNPDKLREFGEIFRDLPLALLSLASLEITFEVEETGQTFEDNARLKALVYSRASGLLTLADDSGIEVDALGGEPGVLSSRFAGPDASGAERNRILLERMKEIPSSQRGARYRCVIALAQPGAVIAAVEGTCEGQITSAPRGTGGFGYDPIFYLPQLGKTMAELPSEEKHELSHRGRAARAARAILENFVRESPTSQDD